MNQEEIKTLVSLKYVIPDSLSGNHPLLLTYPKSVLEEWSWNCCISASHLDKLSLSTIIFIKKVRSIKSGKMKLADLHRTTPLNLLSFEIHLIKAFNAYLRGEYLTAISCCNGYIRYIDQPSQWKLYQEFLIQLLCDYETNKATI